MEIQNHTIRFNDALIHYVTAGKREKRPFVFLHGAPWGMKSWDVVKELANYFYVISPEQPGFGRSDPLPIYKNLPEQYAEVVYYILKQEGLENAKPIILAQSFGGNAAHGYIKRYPKNISCLVLTDAVMPTMPVPRTWRIFLLQVVLSTLGGTLVPFVPRFIKKFIVKKVWHRYTIVWNSLETHPWRVQLLAYNTAVRMLHSQLTQRPYMEVDYSVCPILMLWGELDGEEHIVAEGGGITHINIAKQLFERIREINPSINFIVLRGGHTILYDDTPYVIEKIIEGLQKFNIQP